LLLLLSERTLPHLPPEIARPRYDRRATQVGIVHFGIGAFHRAHQAVFSDALLTFAPTERCAIVGVSLQNPRVSDALAPQDFLCSLALRDRDRREIRIIGSVKNILVAPRDLERLFALLCEPAVGVVTMTVTEKGYCHDPSTRSLNENHEGVRHDLSEPTTPRTLPGLLVEAILRRRKAEAPPFTVLSCDNLLSNGDLSARVVCDFAELRQTGLSAWIADNVAFPNCMVDRIVPATTDDDRREIADAIGLEDAWPIVTEPFVQWVIEDRFTGSRPAWERVGAQLVGSVEPFERMKLRLLNGAHSMLAYLGYLGGYRLIAEAIEDPAYARLIREMWAEEVIPTLELPAGVDVGAYTATLLKRFANPALRHTTWQIAMDGSQKLPQRWLGVIRERLGAGAPVRRLCLGVAAWLRYVAGVDESGEPIDVRDPLRDEIAKQAEGVLSDPDRLALALLSLRTIFGDDLPANPIFVANVQEALRRLCRDGARRTVAEF
jgi:fructuronate reductase